MKHRAHEIVAQLKDLHGPGKIGPSNSGVIIAMQNSLMGELSVLLAEEADRQSRRLVWLTWAIVALTAVIVLFTVGIYQDARAQHEHDTTPRQTQN